MRASTLSNSRTFSIAIAAWSANVATNSICLSVNGRTSERVKRQHADRNALAQHRHAEHGAVIAQSLRLDQGVFRISLYVGDMNDLPFKQGASSRRASLGLDRNIFDMIHELAR